MLNIYQFFNWLLKILKYQLVHLRLVFKNHINVIKHDESREIPICRGLPFFGTLFDLIASGGAPFLHKYIDKRHCQYGPIFRERLGGTQDAIFVSSANLMRSVFLHEGQTPRHPLPDAWLMFNKKHKCRRGLFFMDGTEWFHNRRVLNRILINGNLDWMDVHIDAATDKLMLQFQNMLDKHNADEYTEIDHLERRLYRWSIDVVCRLMFGSEILKNHQIETAINNFSQIVHTIFENSALLMNFPAQWAKFFNLGIWRNFEQSVLNVLQQGSAIIDLFIELTANISCQEHEVLFYKLQELKMPPDMIKRIFVDLIIAGGDTSAFSSQWALYALSQNPELLTKISKYDDSENYTAFIKGFIKEVLRLFPIAPFIGRYLAKDAIIDGYRIKKNTLVLLSLYTAGRDATHFPNPLKVWPERWQRNSKTDDFVGVIQAHGTLPFGIGNRSCIGRRVAIKQLQSFIVAFAKNFATNCNNELHVDCILRMVTVPNQKLHIAIKRRVDF